MLGILLAIVAGLIAIAAGATASVAAIWALGALAVGFALNLIVAILE